jgi:hypothetical protein
MELQIKKSVPTGILLANLPEGEIIMELRRVSTLLPCKFWRKGYLGRLQIEINDLAK